MVVVGAGQAVFSATASGASPLAYQWQKNSANLVNGGKVSGETSNVLTLSTVALANAGTYRLIAANAYGSITSAVAVLTVDLLAPQLR